MFEFENIQKLNDLELLVYNYVSKNPERVVTMKIRELAQAVHVSTTTILRFCKKMNCNGYSEFLFKYRQYLSQAKTCEREDDGILIDFLNKVQQQEFTTRIHDVVMSIKEAKQVIFLGIGSSGVAAKYGARYLSSVGQVAQYIDDPFYPVPRDYYQGAVIIVLTVSGETKQTVEQLERFAHFDCTVVAITNSEMSTIAKMADLVLAYYIPMDMLAYEVNITTQIPALYFIERIGKGVQQELADIEKV